MEDTADTSKTVEPAKDTSTNEPAQQLYAGKYKSVEELEKGYNEAQKSVSKAAEYEKKYNELLNTHKISEQNAKIEKLKNMPKVSLDKEIRDMEYKVFANNLSISLNPEQAKENLEKFVETKDYRYLQEAKKHFPNQFLEDAAVAKMRYGNALNDSIQNQIKELEKANHDQLMNTLSTEFKDFLADKDTNTGKAYALNALSDLIASSEDMKAFQDIYTKIADYERKQALQEYEAKKSIDEIKAKAQINSGVQNFVQGDTPPTYAQLKKMSQKEFNEACDKYGVAAIMNAK